MRKVWEAAWRAARLAIRDGKPLLDFRVAFARKVLQLPEETHISFVRYERERSVIWKDLTKSRFATRLGPAARERKRHRYRFLIQCSRRLRLGVPAPIAVMWDAPIPWLEPEDREVGSSLPSRTVWLKAWFQYVRKKYQYFPTYLDCYPHRPVLFSKPLLEMSIQATFDKDDHHFYWEDLHKIHLLGNTSQARELAKLWAEEAWSSFVEEYEWPKYRVY